MLVRTIIAGVALCVAAATVSAQTRGTVEFGVFGSRSSFDNNVGMSDGWGGGARIGAFLLPRLSVEFEGTRGRASRSQGLGDVNSGTYAARLTLVPMKVKRLAVLLGAGVDHTDTDAFDGYGFQGLVGAKFAISDVVALRADGIRSWMSNPNGANNTGHLGLSIYRKPRIVTSTVTRTVTRDMPQPPVAQRPDSVSAAETLRLRGQEARYLTLRDSLARPVEAPYMPASSAAALATMQQMIYFGNNSSELSDSAKAVLLAKVAVFRTNPAMRIVIAGFTSRPGTEPYNMALGLRRAEAAKAYLVTQGVDPVRIELATRGEGQLVLDGPGETADAANRRGQFRLLVADPYLINPQR